MIEMPTFWLTVLAVLMAYLCVSIGRQLRAEEARRRERERRLPPGKAFDASTIAPQIQRLRQDHFAAVPTRPHRIFYRRGLIAVALQAVTRLSYFHRATLEHEVHKDSG
jgi:hypothetical protein